MSLPARKQELSTVIKPSKERIDYNLATKPQKNIGLNTKQQIKVNQKIQNIKSLEALLVDGLSLHKSCLALVAIGAVNCAVDTLKRDYKKYTSGQSMGLKSKSSGTQRKQQEWDKKAAELYLQTSQPNPNAIANMLRFQYGYETATYYRVTNYLKQFSDNAPMRVGKHNHRLNMGRYKDRSTDNLKVGECYMGDGYRMDIYVAHPVSGHPVRFEMTAWIDVKSRYVTGVYFEHDESSLGTLYSLSEAIDNHNHVPHTIYIDNGPGFKSKIMTNKHTGFYARNDIEPIFSIAGNPRGKTQIERFFRTFKQQLLALLGTGYCAKDQDGRSAALWFNAAKNKGKNILSFNQMVDAVKSYIEQYNNQPHGGLKGQTPASLWQQLEASPPIDDAIARTRPQVKRKVQHGGRIALHNRQYDSGLLVSLKGAEVIVEYSLLDDSTIDVFDLEHNFIATMEIAEKVVTVPSSRIEESKQNRLKNQTKKLNIKIKQNELQAATVIDLQIETIKDIGMMNSLQYKKQPNLIDIDISQLSTE